MVIICHSLIGPDDLFDVKTTLEPVIEKWKQIGLALRLDPSELKKIKEENKDDPDECLVEMLTLWLNRKYNTKKFGNPSWELLAKAVGHPSGGQNPELAKRIAG